MGSEMVENIAQSQKRKQNNMIQLSKPSKHKKRKPDNESQSNSSQDNEMGHKTGKRNNYPSLACR